MLLFKLEKIYSARIVDGQSNICTFNVANMRWQLSRDVATDNAMNRREKSTTHVLPIQGKKLYVFPTTYAAGINFPPYVAMV